MYEVLDGDHEASIKHEGPAKRGIGGLAEVRKPHEDSSKEVFKKGGKVKNHK
jgi:hypothetical protein